MVLQVHRYKYRYGDEIPVLDWYSFVISVQFYF